MATRYQVVEGSVTAHCCFEFTVVDTKTLTQPGDRPKPICECFEKDDAHRIAAAMNVADLEERVTQAAANHQNR